MATQTTNLGLTKPDISDRVSPTGFNGNFDVIDENIADLNSYKETITDTNNLANTLNVSVEELKNATTLQDAKAYTNVVASNIGALIDKINGEVTSSDTSDSYGDASTTMEFWTGGSY